MHIFITGKVQGVGFRKFTLLKALQCQLTGWVRNQEDGSVECFAEGEPDKLEEFLRFLQAGPKGARVDNIEKRISKSVGFQSFEILIP